MSLSNNYPNAIPSLVLDFANTKKLDPRVTFTRASTATFYDGKTVAKAEENLLLQSQTFDTVTNGWTVDGITLSANNTAAPDGTTTAELLTATAVNQGHYIYGSTGNKPTLANTTYTLSVFAKANGYNHVTVSLGGTSSAVYAAATFDLSAVTVSKTGVGGTGGTLTSSSITSVGNGWYRLVITGSVTQAAGFILFGLNTNGTPTYGNYGLETFTGDGTSGVFLWGAQLEQRSSVTAYTATTTAPITNYIPALQTAASGVARFEHNPVTGESLGLEIEEQRTNLVLRSEEFDNASWNKDGSAINANALIAPDGTLTADKLRVTTTTVAQIFNTSALTFTAQAYTWSVFAKAGELNWIAISAYDGAHRRTWFNLSTGAVGTNAAGNTATITAVGNGWYRCTVSRTASATSSGYWQINLANADNTTTTPTDGWSGVYIWGAQLEAGAFATSYIKTEGSQVTRSADSASMTGTNFSSWYRADEGTVYSEAQTARLGVTSRVVAEFSDNTANFRIQQWVDTNGNLSFFVTNNGTTQVNSITSGTATANVPFKLASTYKANDFASSGNSSTVATDTLGTIPSVNKLQFGARFDNTVILNGTIKKLAYYPLRLTNAELQGLTTV